MSKGGLHLILIYTVDFECDPSCALPVAVTKCLNELLSLRAGHGPRGGYANPAQVLRLKTKVASTHADTVRLNEELTDRRHQQTSENFEIPLIRLDEI